jgi:hypothetical protein
MRLSEDLINCLRLWMLRNHENQMIILRELLNKRLLKLKIGVYNYRNAIIAFCFFVISLYDGYAQFYSTGQDPYLTVWEQIKTENFQLIYPKEFYKEANRLANILDYCYEYSTQSLDRKPRKISVILHNSSVLSNGYVSWAPKRMEFVTTPQRESYAEDWLEQLALHEFRHVVQIDKLNQGLTKFLSLIFGQQATGAITGYLPLWFMEGDAVVTETALSSTGRGRLPSFEMKLKAFFTEYNRRISYDKLYLRSYRDYIPDYYYSGYYMVAYSRLKYDVKFCSKVLNDVARKPYLISPFYFGLKKNYGLSKIKLFEETFDTLKNLWNIQIDNIDYTNYQYISEKKSKFYTSYRYPQYINDSTIVVLKSGLDQIDRFVSITKKGQEKIIHTPGYISSERISVSKNKIVWDEIIWDPRWNQRSYSVIKVYDLESGKEKQLTRRSRYFSPAVSYDGNKIVAVEIDNQNKCFLTVINIHNGDIEKRIPSPSNKLLQLPAWTENGQIIAISVNEEGKGISRYDPANQEWDDLFYSEYIDISQPVQWNDHILFRGGFNGIDNIYAFNIESQSVSQLTSARYGAFDPYVSLNDKYLVYADYSSNGYKAVSSNIDSALWLPLNEVTDRSLGWPSQLAKQEGKNIQESDIADLIYKPQHYSRLANLFNFHSWYPFYIDIDFGNIDFSDLPVSPGITILSQNKLSTAISSIGYSYENGEHYFYPKITYSGFYPVIEFSARLGGPSNYLKLDENIDPPQKMSYNKSYFIKSYLPLKFNNNRYTKLIRPQVEYEYNTLYYFDGGYKSGISSIHYKLGIYRYLKLSPRDIDYKWGQVINFAYTHTPGSTIFGSIFSANSRLYFPGLFRHHSLRLYGGIQKQNPERFIYSINRVLFPRGYPNYYSEKFWKVTFDYAFPLFYPDLSIGPFAYIKRIKLNLFYDHAYGYNVIENTEPDSKFSTGTYNSAGAEITSDLNIIRFFFPFDCGVRCSYLPEENSLSFEFLISLDAAFFYSK